MKPEPYRIYQCSRCKKLELNWNAEARTVGECLVKERVPVKVMKKYTLEHPAPDCGSWVKGKPKKCKKEKK